MISPLAVLISLLPFIVAKQVRLDANVHRELLLNGRPQVGLWQSLLREAENKAAQDELLTSPSQQPFSKPKFQAHCHEQPITHFSSSPNTTFCQRYWMDASSYKEGGPVFLLDGGETSGEDRIPFLEKGILQILSNATGGLAIVLEHRYYGESVPVSSFSTDNLRFLNNAEAMADSAHFIKTFQPPKELLSHTSALRHNNTPWIYYGGSYAGARAAHMRVQYPELVWGAIASSAVTHAQIVFPEYYDPIQKYAPEDCISTLQSAITTIDTVLGMPGPVNAALKALFGLPGLSDADFADTLSTPLGEFDRGSQLGDDLIGGRAGYWQGKNWDPAVGSDGFQQFCDALTAGGAGTKIGLIKIPAEVVNYASYIQAGVVAQCPKSGKSRRDDIQDCFGSNDDDKYLVDDLSQTWRLWLFQVCTQWGYFMPAPLDGPSIVSKYQTLEHTMKICKQAYPPGKAFAVPPIPDVEEVNRRGDYGIEYSRLAFIDGDRDPWRPMTPGSDAAPSRTSSVDKPVHLIFDGVHHYDENGLLDHSLEPTRIRDVHALETSFILEWLEQWKEAKEKEYD